MKIQLLLVLLFCVAFQFAFSQKYFDLFYANIPKHEHNKYSSSFTSGMGWIQTGEYSAPAGCTNCSDYSVDSKLRKTKLDSLVAEYSKSGLGKIYSRQYIPNNLHFVPRKQNEPLYIIKTLYKIEDNKPVPVQQIKMTFYQRTGRNPGIQDLEINTGKTMKAIDPKIVMASYNAKVKADKDDDGPPIEKIN